MKTELNKLRNEVGDIGILKETLYENIFTMYKEGNHYAYNILKKVNIPRDLQDDTYYYVRVYGNQTWTQISLQEYGDINLWWLICAASGIRNPVLNPAPGTMLRVIKRSLVMDVINDVNSQLGAR